MEDEHPLRTVPTFTRLMHSRWGMGWRPDRPDLNRRYGLPPIPISHLPEETDLRQQYRFPVWDQGSLGSCTAQALVACLQYMLATDPDRSRQRRNWTGSRLALYYNERWLEGTTASDSGASLADGLRVLSWLGIPPEEDWPYRPQVYYVMPPTSTYLRGVAHKTRGYHAVPQSHTAIVSHLAAGIPVVIGFSVYESFESDDVMHSGVVPLPQEGEQLQGGHALLLVGHSDKEATYLARNSWGLEWGRDGYCTLPYNYVHDAQLTGALYALERSDL